MATAAQEPLTNGHADPLHADNLNGNALPNGDAHANGDANGLIPDMSLAEFIPGDNIAMFYIIFGATLTITHTIYIILSNHPSTLGWFAYHPPLLAIGLGALAYGISPLQTAHPSQLASALDLHALLAGFIATPLFIIGASVEWTQKDAMGKEHLSSWHGMFGAIAVTWVIFQSTMGFILGNGYLPKKYNKYHRASGYALLTLLGLTLAWGGLWSNFVNKKAQAWTATRWIVYAVGTGSVVGGVLARARRGKLGF